MGYTQSILVKLYLYNTPGIGTILIGNCVPGARMAYFFSFTLQPSQTISSNKGVTASSSRTTGSKATYPSASLRIGVSDITNNLRPDISAGIVLSIFLH